MPDPAYRWTVTEGPWFDNNLAMCRVQEEALELVWVTGDVVGQRYAHPRLRQVHRVRLETGTGGGPATVDRGPAPRNQEAVA